MKLAISYNINIITGSMPLIKEEDGRLYNVGFLCRRDGTYEMYEKIHVTPDEIKSWGLSGGKSLQTFDTDCAKIGVLIRYDVEFPEAFAHHGRPGHADTVRSFPYRYAERLLAR